VLAHEDDVIYGQLLKSITGVVFLGTPHGGSNAAILASAVGRIVNAFLPVPITSGGLQPRAARTDLLDYLKPGSSTLNYLSQSVRHRLADLMIISFHESSAQSPMPFLVSIDAEIEPLEARELLLTSTL